MNRRTALIEEAQRASRITGTTDSDEIMKLHFALGYLAAQVTNREDEITELKRNNGMTDSEVNVMLVDMATA